MPSLTHFAINADDPDAARDFYQAVFGWTFDAWGPPGFYRADADTPGGPGVTAAIQQRRGLVPGERTVGFECTIAVEDVDETLRAVVAAGGRVVHATTTIATVGRLAWFADVSGNVVGAMQFDPDAA